MSAILNLLTMFGPLSGAKFWTAIILAVVQFLHIYSGIDLGLDEATVTAVIGGIGAVLVWLVPNKPKPLTEAEARARTGYTGPIEDRTRR